MSTVAIISPHLDDGVLSCGELIRKNIINNIQTTLITIFTGTPLPNELSYAAKQYHSNCFLSDDAMEYRKQEDIKACDYLGCGYLHLNYYECLYRKDENGKSIYPDLSDIYHYEKADDRYCEMLERDLSVILNQYDKIYAPIGIGKHADHLLVRQAINRILIERQVFFYEEVPYIGYEVESVRRFFSKNMTPSIKTFSDDEWEAKVQAILFYRSQLHIMWKNEQERINQLKKVSYLYGSEHSLRLWKGDVKK